MSSGMQTRLEIGAHTCGFTARSNGDLKLQENDYQTKLFINNSFVDAINGGALEVINPATTDIITSVCCGDVS
jgi:hypothetical protein